MQIIVWHSSDKVSGAGKANHKKSVCAKDHLQNIWCEVALNNYIEVVSSIDSKKVVFQQPQSTLTLTNGDQLRPKDPNQKI